MTGLMFNYTVETDLFGKDVVVTGQNEKFFFTETFRVKFNDPNFLTLIIAGVKTIRKNYDDYLTAQGEAFIHKIRDLNVTIQMANKGERIS